MNELALEDDRQIAAILLRYATGIDTRDWPLFGSCFTDDLVADYGPFGSWHGAEAITRAMEEMHAELGPTLHRITNIVATATDSGATARSYVDVILLPGEPGGSRHRGCGYYDDELVKKDGEWQIRRRKYTSVYLANP